MGIWAARTRFHVHHAQSQSSNSACQPRSTIERHLLAGHRINSNLPAEKQLILVAQVEIEDPSIFQKKLPLFRNKNLERRQVELLLIHVRVGEIRICCKIRNQIGAQPVLHIQSSSQWKLRVFAALLVVLRQSVRFNDEDADSGGW